MGVKEGTWIEQAGRSRDQELGCSEVLGIALRASFGGDGGGELRGLESSVRPNPNCRAKLVALQVGSSRFSLQMAVQTTGGGPAPPVECWSIGQW